jgi:hypothetical protein
MSSWQDGRVKARIVPEAMRAAGHRARPLLAEFAGKVASRSASFAIIGL